MKEGWEQGHAEPSPTGREEQRKEQGRLGLRLVPAAAAWICGSLSMNVQQVFAGPPLSGKTTDVLPTRAGFWCRDLNSKYTWVMVLISIDTC